MAKTNYTQYIILGLLLESPMTGYDVKKWAEASVAYFWELSYGQIYPALKKMEEEGLVTMEIDDNTDGPRKKIYTISSKGKDVFCQWMEDEPADDRFKSETTLKLFFGNSIKPDISIESLEKYRSYQEKNLETMKAFEKKMAGYPNTDSHFYKTLTIKKGISVYSSAVKWADETIEMIKNRSFEKSEKGNPMDCSSCMD